MADQQYYGTIPNIQQAFQNDPRTKLAQSQLAAGTSTAPVATGGWGVTDGIARAAQALVGAISQKGQDKKYGEREKAYMQGLQDATNRASAPQGGMALPGGVDPAMGAAGAALAAGQPIGLGSPQGPGGAPPAPPMGPPPGMPPGMPPAPAMGAPAPAVPPAAPPRMPPQGPPTGFTPGGNDPTNTVAPSPMPVTGRAIQRAALTAVPGAIVTSALRTAAHNADVGGVSNSYHLTDQARDLVPPKGMSMDDFHAALTKAAPQFKWINEGTHIHGQPIARNTGTNFPGAPTVDPTNPAAVPDRIAEAVPALPAAPSADAPAAPALPPEIQSNRIAMAKALMASGNPDLAEIAQKYLDKGLDDQQENRKLQNQEQFQQGQTGYQSALSDHNAAVQDARSNAYTEHDNALSRNFQRSQQESNNAFAADQSAKQRALSWQTTLFTTQHEDARNAADNAEKAARAAVTKPLPAAAMKSITDLTNSFVGIRQLADSYKKEYTGSMTNATGRTNLAVQNQLLNYGIGGDKDKVDWWKSMDQVNMGARHQMFGSRLTGPEIQMFDQANITPNTSPQETGALLHKRIGIASSALQRAVHSYMAQGYSKEAIMDAMGPDAVQMLTSEPTNPDLGSDQPQTRVQRRQGNGSMVAQAGGQFPQGTGASVMRGNAKYYQDAQGNWHTGNN